MNKLNALKSLDTLIQYYIKSFPEENAATKMLDFYRNVPNCFQKDNQIGHFTGSAWVVSPDRKQILMTHHKKLNMWLQLGGHADGSEDLINVAMREAKEESGFENFILVSDKIFDLDIHEIPATSADTKHIHYDVRFLLEADPENNEIIISDESHDVRWIHLDEVLKRNSEDSMKRMVHKTIDLK